MLNVTRGGAVETHRMSPDSKTILRSGRLGHKAKWEYFRALYERYRKAGREAKRVMLNEFCWNTGYNRKYAIRLVNGPAAGKPAGRRPRRRRPRYGRPGLSILAADLGSGRISLVGAAEGLVARLPWIGKRYRMPPAIEKPRLGMSARQIDRRLKANNSERSGNGVGTGAPSPAPGCSIPSR